MTLESISLIYKAQWLNSVLVQISIHMLVILCPRVTVNIRPYLNWLLDQVGNLFLLLL